MLSCSALKYKVVVQRSFYAGVVVTGLYSSLILLILLVFNSSLSSLSSLPFIIALFMVAFYGGKKAYMQRHIVKLSEAGDINVSFNGGDYIEAQMSSSSFYNRMFLFVHLQKKISLTNSDINTLDKRHANVLIFKDAVSDEEYRLLARIINSKRDS